MKKLISLLLIVVLMVSTLSSCSLFVDYTIYSSTVDSNDSSNSVAFEKADKIKFVSTLIGDYTEREDAPKEKKVKINGEEFSYNYYKTRKNECENSTVKNLKNNSQTDVYRDETGKKLININPSTGHLLMYSDLTEGLCEKGGDLTEDKAKKIAEDFIVSEYGKDITETYEFESATRINSSYPIEIGYVVIFRRNIHGYKTNDFLRLRINLQGEIYSVWAANMDVYASADIKVSKSQIERAEKKLLEALETENRKVTSEEQFICIDANGKVYLEASVAYFIDGEFSHGDSCYINVN